MLITNYGLYWKRDRVHWGAGRNPGHLKGVPASSITSNPVDFREQQGVYALFDDGFDLVYVGQAGSKNNRLFNRLKQHRTDHLAERWSQFSWFGIRRALLSGKLSAENIAAHPSLGSVLNHIEAIMIAVTEPPHNRQGGRFGEQVQQFLQHYDTENLGPSIEEMVRELWDKS